jgi:hypothetical protein
MPSLAGRIAAPTACRGRRDDEARWVPSWDWSAAPGQIARIPGLKSRLGVLGCYQHTVLGLPVRDPLCWYSFEERPPSQRIDVGPERVLPERKTERS